MDGSTPAGLTARERAKAQKKEILAEWSDGETIAGISRAYRVPRHIISSLLEEAGVRGDRPDPHFRQREQLRTEVLAYIRENPGLSVDDLIAATGVQHRTLVAYIAGTPERKLVVERRSKQKEYTDQEMEEHIRAVWDSLPPQERNGRGLSRKKYAALSAEGAPSPALYDRRYPSWTAACEAAGVPPGKTYRPKYGKIYPDSAILDAIDRYIEETGRTSYNGYAAWSADKPTGEHPSGSSVILRFGTWNAARRALLERGQDSVA